MTLSLQEAAYRVNAWHAARVATLRAHITPPEPTIPPAPPPTLPPGSPPIGDPEPPAPPAVDPPAAPPTPQ